MIIKPLQIKARAKSLKPGARGPRKPIRRDQKVLNYQHFALRRTAAKYLPQLEDVGDKGCSVSDGLYISLYFTREGSSEETDGVHLAAVCLLYCCD